MALLKSPKRIITGEWRANLNKLKVNGFFFFKRSDRNKVAPEISKHFKECTEKRFTITISNCPTGFAKVTRTEDEILTQVA